MPDMDSTILFLIGIVILLFIGMVLLRLLGRIMQLHAQLRYDQMRRESNDRTRKRV